MLCSPRRRRFVAGSALAALAFVALACSPGGAAAVGPGFKPTLERHLRAVEGRDLATLMSTVTEGEFMLILPNGKVIGSRAAFEAMHREWFAETNWAIKFRVEKTVETAELSYAVASYDYEERPEGGGAPARRRRYVQMVFRKVGDAWKLIHDQNTPIEGAG